MNETMTQGVELMVTGMCIVFLFLVMLIGAVQLMAYCVSTFLPEIEVAQNNSTPSQAHSAKGVTPIVAAAITAAVHRHRATRK